MPPVNQPTDATLDARTFAVLADGAEILERPALLAAFAEVYGPDADATLVLATDAPEQVVESLPAAAQAVGLPEDALPDVLVLPVGRLEVAGGALADVVHAVLTDRDPGPALERLPRCGVADGERLARVGNARAAVAATGARLPPNLALPDGYTSRPQPEYFDDVARPEAEIIHQPEVYEIAAHLARLLGCTHLVDVGCGAADKLLPLAPEFRLIGVDFGSNFEHCRVGHPEHTWLRWDIEREPVPHIPSGVLARSVVICADVIEHLVDPSGLLVGLGALATHAQVVIVSTPDRVLVRGADDLGPPANPAHVREWALDELVELLTAGGVVPAFAGHTINNDSERLKHTSLAITDRRRGGPVEPAPDDFRVAAVLPTFDDADIVERSVRRLVEQGIDVHVVDRATILTDTERIAAELGEGWVIHQDVTEIRVPPWPGVTLRDALHHVQRCGYNAVDHTVIDLRSIDDEELEGDDLEERMRHFAFGTGPGHFLQITTWDAGVGPVELAASGGHEAAFAGRRVFPYKFLSKRPPVRSQAHDRVADEVRVHDDTFDSEYLTERLTGVGILRPDR